MKEIKKSIEIIDRGTEFQEVKDTIREYIDDARYGLFFIRNMVRDPMQTVYIGKIFTVDICRNYGYFEVFGCTAREERMLTDYYNIMIKGAEE